MWPKITVVTPSYNHARFLGATLQSVYDQIYPNLEHIIIDGGSTDGSIEVIRRYEERVAYWISESDGGQTEALIKGFAQATGDILCWLNSDDLFESGTLWDVARFFMKRPQVRFVYGDARWIDTEGRVIKSKKEIPFNRFIWLYDYNYIPQPSAFWRRDLYEDVGGLDPRFDLAMDADLWIRFAERTQPVHVRRNWSCVRFYPEQKTQRLRVRGRQEGLIIRRRYIGTESHQLQRVKKLLAKVFRVTQKIAKGCYW